MARKHKTTQGDVEVWGKKIKAMEESSPIRVQVMDEWKEYGNGRYRWCSNERSYYAERTNKEGATELIQQPQITREPVLTWLRS